MKKLVLSLILVGSSLLQANMDLSWSKNFFGYINQMEFEDINNDGKKDIVLGSENAIFAIDSNGTLLWKNYMYSNVSTLMSIQADSDAPKEFAYAGMLDIGLIDNDGTSIGNQTLQYFSTSVRPIAFIGDYITSFAEPDSSSMPGFIYWYEKTNLGYAGTYYNDNATNIPQYGMASVDSDGDGKNDMLFFINNDYSDTSLYRLDENADEIWHVAMPNDDTVALSTLWVGNFSDRKIVAVVGDFKGNVYAYDSNGSIRWHIQLEAQKQIQKIEKSPEGNLLILSNDKPWLMGSATKNVLYEVDQNGTVLWGYDTNASLTTAFCKNSETTVSANGPKISFLDKNGTLISKYNINNNSEGDVRYDVHVLKSTQMDNKQKLFAGWLDVDELLDMNASKTIYEGGTLVESVATGDIDGDGVDEVAFSDSNRLYLFDNQGNELWSKFGYMISNIVNFDDLNGDGKDELITEHDGNITVLNGQGETLWSVEGYYSNIYPGIDLSDYDDDGLHDLFVSSLDYDTQQYLVKVYKGTDGSLLHEYGAIGQGQFIKVMEVNGSKRLYISDYNQLKWVDINATDSTAHYTDYGFSNQKLIFFKDENQNGIADIVIGNSQYISSDEYNLTILNCDLDKYILYNYDYSTQTYSFSGYNNMFTITLPSEAKSITPFDYDKDGVDEILIAYDKGLALYKLDGTKMWDVDSRIDNVNFEENRFYDVKVVHDDSGDKILVSGTSLYIFDKDGRLLEKLKVPIGAVSLGYVLPFDMGKKSNTGTYLAIGGLGIYAYDGLNYDTTNLPKITYKANQWHLVATPVDKSISLNQFKDLKIAWKYQDDKWYMYSSSDAVKEKAQELNIEEFSAIVPTQGVWVKNYADGSISVSGVQNTLPTSLPSSTWSLIGGVKTSVSELHSKYPNADLIYKYTQNGWVGKSYIPDNSLDTLDNIEANEGFWVHVK
jgi:hypothetical protein